MKYLRVFVDAFMESAATEFGVQLARLMIWAWRGAYFAAGVLFVVWLFGIWRS